MASQSQVHQRRDCSLQKQLLVSTDHCSTQERIQLYWLGQEWLYRNTRRLVAQHCQQGWSIGQQLQHTSGQSWTWQRFIELRPNWIQRTSVHGWFELGRCKPGQSLPTIFTNQGHSQSCRTVYQCRPGQRNRSVQYLRKLGSAGQHLRSQCQSQFYRIAAQRSRFDLGPSYSAGHNPSTTQPGQSNYLVRQRLARKFQVDFNWYFAYHICQQPRHGLAHSWLCQHWWCWSYCVQSRRSVSYCCKSWNNWNWNHNLGSQKQQLRLECV